MISDTDWDLLNKRLESIERSIEMLKAMFPVKEGTLTASSDYVLYEGSLTDAGLEQSWRTVSFDKPVDCVSNVHFHLSCKETKDETN